MGSNAVERRWGCRVAADIDVQLVGLLGPIAAGRLTDISTTGAFVESDVIMPRLSSVSLVVANDATARQTPRHITGYVTRTCSSGFGLAWWDLATDPLREMVIGMLSMPGRDKAGRVPVVVSVGSASGQRL